MTLSYADFATSIYAEFPTSNELGGFEADKFCDYKIIVARLCYPLGAMHDDAPNDIQTDPDGPVYAGPSTGSLTPEQILAAAGITLQAPATFGADLMRKYFNR